MVNQRQGARSPTSKRRDRLLLAGEPQSARAARQFAHDHVMQDAPGVAAEYVDTVVLVTSEIVTNSIRYGTEPGDVVALTLDSSDDRTRVEVRDPVRRHPRPRPESFHRDRGRGLMILDGLCPDAWGVDDVAFGKVVWAEVAAM